MRQMGWTRHETDEGWDGDHSTKVGNSKQTPEKTCVAVKQT